MNTQYPSAQAGDDHCVSLSVPLESRAHLKQDVYNTRKVQKQKPYLYQTLSVICSLKETRTPDLHPVFAAPLSPPKQLFFLFYWLYHPLRHRSATPKSQNVQISVKKNVLISQGAKSRRFVIQFYSSYHSIIFSNSSIEIVSSNSLCFRFNLMVLLYTEAPVKSNVRIKTTKTKAPLRFLETVLL